MHQNLRTIFDIDLHTKRVLIRVDLNVPMQNGKILNDARIRAIIPTIKHALKNNAAIILLSHLGRPKEGEYDKNFSLQSVATHLNDMLKTYPIIPHKSIRFEKNWLQGINISPGEIVLCENVRFNVGEEDNDSELAKQMAKLCDVFVMDAFATAHRSQASTTGLAQYAPIAVAGPLVIQELTALKSVLDNPKRPLTTIIGGSKIKDKIGLLESLLNITDNLIVGGGIANTFLAASGFNVGKSLIEADKIKFVKNLFQTASQFNKHILFPQDVVVSHLSLQDLALQNPPLQNLSLQEGLSLQNPTLQKIQDVQDVQKNQKTQIIHKVQNTQSFITKTKLITQLDDSDYIYDIGPITTQTYTNYLEQSETILWNGPLGVFENPLFESGTKAIATAIANSHAYTVAGGGETLAAIEQYHITDKLSYVSTAGGAFLAYLEKQSLPAIQILKAIY